MIGCIISFILGAFVGIITICCCIAAGRADRKTENEITDSTDISF